jgi:hypothetical protein
VRFLLPTLRTLVYRSRIILFSLHVVAFDRPNTFVLPIDLLQHYIHVHVVTSTKHRLHRRIDARECVDQE